MAAGGELPEGKGRAGGGAQGRAGRAAPRPPWRSHRHPRPPARRPHSATAPASAGEQNQRFTDSASHTTAKKSSAAKWVTDEGSDTGGTLCEHKKPKYIGKRSIRQ